MFKEQHSHIDQKDTVIKANGVKLTLNENKPVMLYNQSITCCIFNVVSSQSCPEMGNQNCQKTSAMANIKFVHNVHVGDNLVMRVSSFVDTQ